MSKPLEVAPGALFYPGYLQNEQQAALLAELRDVIASAPVTPKPG
jgi:alkylated DNA repair dioxygenase AlkB